MSTIINMGSGGGGASIRAIAAANEQALPASKDNTLAVISNVSPTEVYAQNTAPDSPKNGAVWVKVSGNSTAPIQCGKITVYPTAAYQYQNGAWIAVTCYVRHQGAWIPLELVLYRNGDLCVPVTGGWGGATYAAAGVNAESSFNGAPAMRLDASQNHDYTKTGAAVLFTKNKIAVGGYKKLHVTYYKSDNGGRIGIGLSDNQSCAEPNLKSTGMSYGTEDAWATAVLDLSTVPVGTEAYIKIYIHAPGNNDAEIVYVTDVHLTN